MSRATRKRKKQSGSKRRNELLTLYHGTAGATVSAVRKGMKAAENEGLLMFEEPDLARPHAVAAAALLIHGGGVDKTGLIVTVQVRRARAKLAVPGEEGIYWVKGRIKPDQILELSVFDASEELADPEFVADMARRFDTGSQGWRRAAAGEMQP